jgi:hemolysin type calcium-binding protein
MPKVALLVLFGVLLWAPLAGADLQPANISPPGLNASRPLIASDGKGDLVAVWRELDHNAWSIRAAVRSKGAGWHSKRISLPAQVTESPALAMDRQGNAVAAWQRSAGSGSVVQASVRPAGGDWSPSEDLSAPGDTAFGAGVSAEAGNLAAVWVVLRNRQTLVLSSSRAVGGAWSPAETLAGPVGNPDSPRIALDDHGGAVAAWRWSNGAYHVVEAASSVKSGSWSAPVVLSANGRNSSRPHLAMDGAGRALVGWVRSNGDWTVAQVASRSTAGDWTEPVDLSNRAGNVRNLDLDMTRDGHAIASWGQGSPNFDIWSSSRLPGATRWSDPSPVTQNWPGIDADVTLDEQGNATAVWSSDGTVSASFKPVGKPWQDDYLLSNYDDPATAPAVAAYAPTQATGVWILAGDDNDRIQSVDYDINTSADESDGGDEGDGDTGGDGETFMGTPHADRMVGTPGNDVFYGLEGNDTIVGRGGRDLVFGGPGKDKILGGTGVDRLNGGLGDDVILGGSGSDVIAGGAGRDRLLGGRGGDVLSGGAGRDFLWAGFGNDTLLARDRLPDRVAGGRGLDQYRLDRWLDRARSVESRVD